MGDSERYRFGDEVYGFKDEPPARRRSIRMRRPVADELEDDPPPRHARLAGIDPFFVTLGTAGVLWLGLGLSTAVWPWMGLVLAGAGVLVVLASRLYLTLLIYRENPEAALYSLFSKWYRFWYLHQSPELTLKPMIVGIVGLLMLLTGVALFLTRT